jgi:NADP-dependent alcohol dehydrogenase
MFGVWRTLKEQKREKLVQMGKRVFGITTGTPDERAEAAIDATEKFFRSLGVKTRLSEYGLNASIIAPIVKRFADRGDRYTTPEIVKQVLEQRV